MVLMFDLEQQIKLPTLKPLQNWKTELVERIRQEFKELNSVLKEVPTIVMNRQSNEITFDH